MSAGASRRRDRPGASVIHPAAIVVAVLLHGAAGVAFLTRHPAEPPLPPAFSVELPEPAVVSDQAAAPASAEPPKTESKPPLPPVQTTPPQPSPPTPTPQPAEIPPEAPSSLPAPPLSVPDTARSEPAPPASNPKEADLPLPPMPPPSRPAPRSRARPAPPSPGTVPQTSVSVAAAQAPPAAPSISPAWQGTLSAWLLGHRVYPDAARRDGDQGVATLRFTVLRDGAVTGLALVHGSGSSILDDAALAMLRDARVPPFPATMAQPSITITVPVHYTLER